MLRRSRPSLPSRMRLVRDSEAWLASAWRSAPPKRLSRNRAVQPKVSSAGVEQRQVGLVAIRHVQVVQPRFQRLHEGLVAPVVVALEERAGVEAHHRQAAAERGVAAGRRQAVFQRIAGVAPGDLRGQEPGAAADKGSAQVGLDVETRTAGVAGFVAEAHDFAGRARPRANASAAGSPPPAGAAGGDRARMPGDSWALAICQSSAVRLADQYWPRPYMPTVLLISEIDVAAMDRRSRRSSRTSLTWLRLALPYQCRLNVVTSWKLQRSCDRVPDDVVVRQVGAVKMPREFPVR